MIEGNYMGNLNFLYQLDLPHRAKLVYLYLYERRGKDNTAWPGLNTIASDLSLSRSTVKRAIHDLENAGLVKKELRYRQNGSATSNLYILTCESLQTC
jgi:DNA-binding MarR family transcriptional regulator